MRTGGTCGLTARSPPGWRGLCPVGRTHTWSQWCLLIPACNTVPRLDGVKCYKICILNLTWARPFYCMLQEHKPCPNKLGLNSSNWNSIWDEGMKDIQDTDYAMDGEVWLLDWKSVAAQWNTQYSRGTKFGKYQNKKTDRIVHCLLLSSHKVVSGARLHLGKCGI